MMMGAIQKALRSRINMMNSLMMLVRFAILYPCPFVYSRPIPHIVRSGILAQGVRLFL